MNSLIDTNQDDQLQIDENADFIEMLTGPGAKFDRTKYKDEKEMWQAIAKGKVFGDNTVEVQNRKMDELREDYRKLRDEHMTGSALNELMDQIKQLKQSTPRTEPQADTDTKEPGFDPNQLDSLISSKMEARELQKKQDENFRKVQDKLIETFGRNYQEPLKQHINETGLDIGDLDALARKSPTAAIKLLGLDQQAEDSFEAPMRNKQRSSFSPKGQEKRTWSWYQKLRAQDRKTYDDPKTQAQMYADAATLGKEFRDGNFYNV